MVASRKYVLLILIMKKPLLRGARSFKVWWSVGLDAIGLALLAQHPHVVGKLGASVAVVNGIALVTDHGVDGCVHDDHSLVDLA